MSAVAESSHSALGAPAAANGVAVDPCLRPHFGDGWLRLGGGPGTASQSGSAVASLAKVKCQGRTVTGRSGSMRASGEAPSDRPQAVSSVQRPPSVQHHSPLGTMHGFLVDRQVHQPGQSPPRQPADRGANGHQGGGSHHAEGQSSETKPS